MTINFMYTCIVAQLYQWWPQMLEKEIVVSRSIGEVQEGSSEEPFLECLKRAEESIDDQHLEECIGRIFKLKDEELFR